MTWCTNFIFEQILHVSAFPYYFNKGFYRDKSIVLDKRLSLCRHHLYDLIMFSLQTNLPHQSIIYEVYCTYLSLCCWVQRDLCSMKSVQRPIKVFRSVFLPVVYYHPPFIHCWRMERILNITNVYATFNLKMPTCKDIGSYTERTQTSKDRLIYQNSMNPGWYRNDRKASMIRCSFFLNPCASRHNQTVALKFKNYLLTAEKKNKCKIICI